MEKEGKVISAEEMAKEGRRPAILHFRPTHFRKVESPEALKAWERTVLEQVGIHVQAAAGNAYYETVCGTGNFDDCSEEDPGEQVDL